MQHLDEGTIHAWLDGALPDEEARQAAEHAASCEACAAAVAEARGLIAASSMILSKLDTFPAPMDAGSGGAVPPAHDIAAARAAAEARQRPARRSWYEGPGFRAAAAVLVLAGGAAAIQSVTGRDELASVVSDQMIESRASVAESPSAEPMAAQDATAASAEQAPAPPPPVVAAAPVHPRPRATVGGGATANRQAAVATTITAAPADGATGMSTGAAASEPSLQRLEERLRRVESPAERDLSEASKAAAANPAASPPAEAVSLRAGDSLRGADTALAPERARLRQESAQAARGLAPSPAAPGGVTGRIASASALAVITDRADAPGAARCYALTLAPWQPARATIPLAPATRIVLSPDTGTVGPSKGHRLVRPVPGSFEGSYQHAWWTEVSPSTLVLTWATGSEGVIMRLVRSGDALAGTARTFGTTGGAEQSSSVQGSRVDCGDAR